MACVLNDSVKETTTTTGTGAVTLAGAVTSFESFGTGIGVPTLIDKRKTGTTDEVNVSETFIEKNIVQPFSGLRGNGVVSGMSVEFISYTSNTKKLKFNEQYKLNYTKK